MTLAPLQREEMDANHAAARAREQKPARRERNVQVALSLGSTEFVRFRGRAYGVPPVPWRAGRRLLELWAKARSYGALTDPAVAARYYAVIEQLPDLLWSLCRPVGPTRRVLRRLGLHRNPFKAATEQELVELAAFFLERRLKSSIGLPPAEATTTST